MLKKKVRKGFTLVELVVTIAITAIILTTLGTLFYFGIKSNNNIISDKAEFNEANTLKNAISKYFDEYNDETLRIEEIPEETCLFKTDTHIFTFKNNALYLDSKEVIHSQYDTSITVATKENLITYSITYSGSKSIKLVKGPINEIIL